MAEKYLLSIKRPQPAVVQVYPAPNRSRGFGRHMGPTNLPKEKGEDYNNP